MTDMSAVLSAIQQLNARMETEMGSLMTEMKAEIGSMKAEISAMKAEICATKAEISSTGAKVVVLIKQMKVLQGATIERSRVPSGKQYRKFTAKKTAKDLLSKV